MLIGPDGTNAVLLSKFLENEKVHKVLLEHLTEQEKEEVNKQIEELKNEDDSVDDRNEIVRFILPHAPIFNDQVEEKKFLENFEDKVYVDRSGGINGKWLQKT